LVDDKRKTPVKFLQAGIYTAYAATLAYIPIPAGKISRVDSNNTTFIHIRLNDQYQVNKLHLNITAPKYFKRDITIYQLAGKYKEAVSETELNSAKNNHLLFSAKTGELELQISNGDNQPLSISGIDAFQTEEYIISYLEGKQEYRLLTGDSTARAPEYDLKFFADSIKDNIPSISHREVIKNSFSQTDKPKPVKDYTLFTWIAIIAAAGILLLLTMKMMKEVGKKTNKP